MLEGFVFAELLKSVDPDAGEATISHFRDRDQVEVDFVIERAGQLVGIEVKAAVSVGPADLRGLKRLREAAGKSFACGVLLHDGNRIQRVTTCMPGPSASSGTSGAVCDTHHA